MAKTEKRAPYQVRLAEKHRRVLRRLARERGIHEAEALRRLIVAAGGKTNERA